MGLVTAARRTIAIVALGLSCSPFLLPASAQPAARSVAEKHDTGDINIGPQPEPFNPNAKLGLTPCFVGLAAVYPCSNVDLLSFTTRADLSGGQDQDAADIWGWHDRQTGMEVAIVAMDSGTSFVDVTQPATPRPLGFLPTTGGTFPNREANVYADHAFIVADGPNQHGLQVFDLRQLRGYDGPFQQLRETTRYTGFENCHNFSINPDSGFGYGVGSNTCGPGGLHMVDLRDPQNPRFAGCYADPDHAYIHDVQCVLYHGPDRRYARHEICFASNEDALLIVDVTDKSNPVRLARKSYEGVGYTHQAWLTEDHKHLLLDDELDEFEGPTNTRTYIWNVSNLTDPKQFATYVAPTASTDHNQFVQGRYLYQANYRAGLRILDLSKVAQGKLTEVGYFDVVPGSDNPGFDGAWGVYPYLPSGNLLVSGINQGLYVLKRGGPSALPATCRPSADRLCLGGNRYLVEAAWRDASSGASGKATARKGAGATGFLSFTNGEQLEVAVRLTTGGGVGLSFGSVTDRPFIVQVADLKTKKVSTFQSGESFCAGGARLPKDGGAAQGTPGELDEVLAGAPVGAKRGAPAVQAPYRLDLGALPAKHEGTCAGNANTLCLHEGVLAIKLSYTDPASGAVKAARALPLTDGSGGFAFKLPKEPEVVVRAFESGGHIQVAWGGFTSAAYHLEVQNTLDGTVRSYDHAAGGTCGGSDPTAF